MNKYHGRILTYEDDSDIAEGEIVAIDDSKEGDWFVVTVTKVIKGGFWTLGCTYDWWLGDCRPIVFTPPLTIDEDLFTV